MSKLNRIENVLLALGLLTLIACPALSQSLPKPTEPDLASLVNPLVGTDNGGDTFPGAVVPFGMAQLTPNLENNGYYYTDTHMHGFAMNSMSGDGGADEGQVLMTATTGPVKIDRPDTDFALDHAHEAASAGYYRVLMNPWGIEAELTASTHCGMARFTFPAGKQADILLPISYANTETHASHVHFVDDQTITGDLSSQAFDGGYGDIKIYFAMEFSRPFAGHGTWTNAKLNPGGGDADQSDANTVIGAYGTYPASDRNQMIDVRIGISYVDVDGAMRNVHSEMPSGTFEHYRNLAAQAWDKELSVINVQGGTPTHRRIFYTALYHAMIAPNIFDDVDGRYMGFDAKIHTVPAGHAHLYATFSGWDIYRSEMPLLGVIEPRRAEDMAQSIVEMANQLGYIDRWPEQNQPCAVMNGDPLTICLANLWNADIHNFDMGTAYGYMWRQAQAGAPQSHIGVYQGYDEERAGVTLNTDASVSTALEYDESFAALGHVALDLQKPGDANYLFARALQYRDMYNPGSGYLQQREQNGVWDNSFGGYTEGNRDIYRWFVPEDIQGLVNLMGGAPIFDKRLDDFFATDRYDPTNEPDIQAPFLYDYINRPWKTQHIVAETADRCFMDTPGGLAGGGNDDLGTMSAWYILSQIGFYPVDPGVPYFEVCTPRFPHIVIHLEAPHAGTQFVIDAPGAGQPDEYIQSATLNGVPLDKPWFAEAALLSGGEWDVHVGPAPNENWGASPVDRPYSLSTGFAHVPNSPVLHAIVPSGRDEFVSWRFTTSRPSESWIGPNFDDSTWRTGVAGFGTEDQGVTPRTPWDTDDIWMRKTFLLAETNLTPVILAYHDQDIEVYLNGVLAATVSGWTHSYDSISISEQALATLHAGENVIAVHVRHPGPGRHFADVGLSAMDWPESEK